MIEVAVIGAGPSGLVACRHLLRVGLRPTLLEQSASVAGAWNSANPSSNMWDDLTANLSKYTCRFSDLDHPPDVPTFPTRRHMQAYLERYARHYLGDPPLAAAEAAAASSAAAASDPSAASASCTLRHGSTVTKIRAAAGGGGGVGIVGGGGGGGFVVEWDDASERRGRSRVFDGVVVASGFFASPVAVVATPEERSDPPSPSTAQDGDDDDDDDSGRRRRRRPVVVHSAEYKSPDPYRGQTVAVAGGAFSALEIASDLCRTADRVVSILPRVPWVLPRYLPYEGGSLPVDLVLYRRGADAPVAERIRMDADSIKERHEVLRRLVGTRKQSAAIGLPDPDSVPIVCVSDDYLDLVLSGQIEVVRDRFRGIGPDDGDDGRCLLESGMALDGVDAVIACTGYRSDLGEMLSVDVRSILEYDPSDEFAPLTLCYDCFHPDIPGLGFVGMYRGPYLGVMEMQARLLADLWSDRLRLSDDQISKAVDDCRTRRRHRPRAQFPRFDYVGAMDEMSALLGLVPPEPFGSKGSMVTPAFYQPSSERSEIAARELDEEVLRGRRGADMPRVVLRALVGTWRFERTIRHFNADMRQRVVGTVRFTLHNRRRDRDSDGENDRDSSNQTESADRDSYREAFVSYREDGVLRMENGREMEVFREYQYLQNDDQMEIYFVEGGKRAHLFLGLKFRQSERSDTDTPGSDRDGSHWTATSDHLCIKDLYKGLFEVKLDGISASEIKMTYRVKGPNKDYESVTLLVPDF